MKSFQRRALGPLVFAFLCATTYLLAKGFGNVAIVSSIMLTVSWPFIWGLEQLFPHRPEWNRSDGQRWNDVGHAFVGTAGGAILGNRLAEAAFTGFGLYLASKSPTGRLFPTSLPFAAQVVLVYLVADLGRYVQHRLLHRIPWLWKFHELHHSTPYLSVWKTSRSHVVERIFQQVFMFGPLILLGVPETVLAFYVVPNSFLGQLAHSNLDLDFGLAERVIMGPGAHRLHHSYDMAQGNTNFGSALVVWDRLFRTYTDPVTTPPPARMGIPNDPTPDGFFQQVVAPFRRRG